MHVSHKDEKIYEVSFLLGTKNEEPVCCSVEVSCMSVWGVTSYGRKGIFPLYTNWMLNNLAAAAALGAADGLQGNGDNSVVIFHILQSIIFKD